MKQSFPSIVDVSFTANMESLLDKVADGTVAWKTVVSNLSDLDEAVTIAEKELESVKIEDEVTDEICELCGRNMVIKYGPHGNVPWPALAFRTAKYETLSGEDRRSLSQVRQRGGAQEDEKGPSLLRL